MALESNWRNIRQSVGRKMGRIDRATAEKSRKMSEITNLIGQGASLYDRWATGKGEQKALEEFGTSEGLTYDKKTKSFYGDQDGQGYKISPAELKTMQSFQKYTDQGISDFISKDGNIKKGYQFNPITPDKPDVSLATEDTYSTSDLTAGDTDYDFYQSLGGDKNLELSKEEYISANIANDPNYDPSKVVRKGVGELGTEDYPLVGKDLGQLEGTTLENWKTASDVDEGFRKTAVGINKAKEDEMKELLNIQTKKTDEAETKRLSDIEVSKQRARDEGEKRQKEEKIKKELDEFNKEKIELESARAVSLEKATSPENIQKIKNRQSFAPKDLQEKNKWFSRMMHEDPMI